MSNTWLTRIHVVPGNRNRRYAARALKDGNLFAAVQFARREPLDSTISGRRILKRLTGALISCSTDERACGNFARAWDAITAASDVAMALDRDRISKEKNTLVELTIEAADELLTNARVVSATRLVRELRNRAIRDWRAERIEETGELIEKAENARAKGNFEKAIELLSQAHELRPDLTFIQQRIAGCQLHARQLHKLTGQLKKALLHSNRLEVERICREMLVLAPGFQLAVDAYRRMATVPASRRRRQSQPVQNQSLLLSCPTPPAGHHMSNNVDSRYPDSRSHESQSGDAGLRDFDGPDAGDGEDGNFVTIADATAGKMEANLQPFMIWIDAVGGFLVCPGSSNIIGQAVPNANIQIPLTGDLQRRHVRIESVDGAHLIHPLGQVSIDERDVTESVALCDGQSISLGHGPQLQFKKTHPLSSTAFLDFTSRHRTQPWSDGVLLASGPIMLGPDPKCHVVCPKWPATLMLFHRDGKWLARCAGKLEIDSVIYEGEGPLELTSRIQTENFSMTLEPFSG